MSEDIRFRSFGEAREWASDRGFTLWNRRYRGGPHYPLKWVAPCWHPQEGGIADLAGLAAFVQSKIDAGEALRPGVWHISWDVEEYRDSEYEWCPYRRWVHVSITEGAVPRYPRFCDQTAFDSREAALAQSALLSLEMAARLEFAARINPLWALTDVSASRSRDTARYIPTTECTDVNIEEMVVALIRGWYSPGYVSHHLKDPEMVIMSEIFHATNALHANTEAAIERMLADGRLIRAETWDHCPAIVLAGFRLPFPSEVIPHA